ncbi:MAG: hypothetical protein WA634_19390 [Silvibacterium sp.]
MSKLYFRSISTVASVFIAIPFAFASGPTVSAPATLSTTLAVSGVPMPTPPPMTLAVSGVPMPTPPPMTLAVSGVPMPTPPPASRIA